MILITGAGGFIGHHLCQSLSALGRPVLAVDQAFPTPLPCPMLQGDLRDTQFLAGLFQGRSIEAVVHLAALLNTASRQNPAKAMQVNIGASLALLAYASESGVSRFIYGSTISVYGYKPRAVAGPVAETEPAAPENIYGASKRFVEIAGEQGGRQQAACQQAARQQAGLQFIALRVAMVVGPGAVNTASPWRSQIFEVLSAGQPAEVHLPFARSAGLPLIHVSDVAACIQRLLAASRPAHTIYNTPVENWECDALADTIQALNPQISFTFSPSGQRGDPEAIDGSRFTAEFGFQPLPIAEHLRRAAEGFDSRISHDQPRFSSP